jgi:uncharacterized protein
MDLFDTESTITFLCGIAMLVGVVGVVVPALPGLVLCWLSVLVWAIFAADGWGRWVVLITATALAAAGTVVKYTWPGRNLRQAGIPNRSLLVGGLLGLVGFFLIPIVGLVLGFVLGIWLAERSRLADPALAWPSTKHAVKAAGLAMLIELSAALAIALTWVAGLALA